MHLVHLPLMVGCYVWYSDEGTGRGNKAKNVKSHVFLILKKTLKNVKVMTCKVLETTQSVCVQTVSVSIKLLRPYFNQQFYIMYVLFVVSERTV